MKALLTKVSINEGVSKKKNPEGTPYSISTASILVPFEPRSWNNENGQGQSRGYGLDIAEIELDASCLDSFKDLKFPVYLELETVTEYRRSGAVSVITGFQKA